MKLNAVLLVAGLCGGLIVSASAQSDRRPTPPSGPAEESSAVSARPPLTFAEAQKLLAGDRKYVAHPPETGADGKVTESEALPAVYRMDDPPPAPRPEGKPAAPGPDLVWVDGHYMPVEHEWRWVMGAWAKPATPISVWIPGRFNEKEKKWFPGYWEPDRPPMTPADSPTATKTAAPTTTVPSGKTE